MHGRAGSNCVSVTEKRRRRTARLVAAVLSCVLLSCGILVATDGGEALAAPSTWQVADTPNPTSVHNGLSAVSCPTSSNCVAVGNSHDDSGNPTRIIEKWDGTTWSEAVPPTLGGELRGVSCVSVMSCVAVGDYLNQTLIETWDGSQWSVTPGPNPDTNQIVYAVSCVSVSMCVAVGDSSDGTIAHTLIESWDGTKWTVVPSPNQGTGHNFLFGVSCVSTASCVAVGYSWPASGLQTLIETWDGSAWTITSSPSPDTNDEFYGISCISSSFCTAVGDGWSGQGPTTSLVETWDGSAWKVASTPNPGSAGTELSGVWCTSATMCVAAGYQWRPLSVYQTLVESWNGTAWTVSPTPDKNQGNNMLLGVSCPSAPACVAVGQYQNGLWQTLALSGSTPSVEALQVSTTSLRFGKQRVGTHGGLQTVTLKNTGTVPVSLQRFAVGGAHQVDFSGDTDCYGHTLPVTLGPGASCHVALLFAPTGIGTRTASFEVFSSFEQTAAAHATAVLPSKTVTLSGTGTEGYYLAGAHGEIGTFGDALFYGSATNIRLSAPIISLATTPNGGGYWLLGKDGGIFSYGNAHFYGSTGSIRLNKPIVAMTASRTGKGYRLVASDGGIFAFGDAHFYGSTASLHLTRPVIGMAATPDDHGYWIVTSNGAVYAFGDGHYYGGTATNDLTAPITQIAPTPTGHGYWLLTTNGQIFAFGDAHNYGTAHGQRTVGMAITPDGHGYWETTSAGRIYTYGDAQPYGDVRSLGVSDVIAVAGTAPMLVPQRIGH